MHMEVTINQQNYQLNEPCSVAQMLALVQAPAKGIAVAINQTIVSKSNWAVYVLKQGDQVMIIKATQGG
jgi:sulfur carrier protein